MNKADFLEQLQDVFQREEPLELDMNLSDIEEWDSLTMMGILAFFDTNFGINLTFNDLKKMKTINDIANKAKIQ